MFPKATNDDVKNPEINYDTVDKDLIEINENLFVLIMELVKQNKQAKEKATTSPVTWNRNQRNKVWEITHNFFVVTQRIQYLKRSFVKEIERVFNQLGRVTVLNQGGEGGGDKPSPEVRTKKCGVKVCVLPNDGRNYECTICICASKDGKEQCADPDEICPTDPDSACGECGPCPGQGGNSVATTLTSDGF
jgi:hypothetical protein